MRTQILSVDNGSKGKNVMHRSVEAKAPSGNVTVAIESQDVTPDTSSSDAKGAKVIPPPPTPPSKDDFVVQIKSVERVDGKKPIRPRQNVTAEPSRKAAEMKKSGLDIKIWTVTDAPKARNQVSPSRLEYSKEWADDWGANLRLTGCSMVRALPLLAQVMNGGQQLTSPIRERRTPILPTYTVVPHYFLNASCHLVKLIRPAGAPCL